MEKITKILMVEDLPSDADLAIYEAGKVFGSLETKVVETKNDFVTALIEWEPDIVISDFQLPSFDGLSAVKIILEQSPLTPIIILTGSMNEDTAVDCMKAGATDYVIKEHIKRLGPALLRAIEQKKSKFHKLRIEEELKLLSRSVEQSSVSIVITDSKGIIQYVNPFATKITGYTSAETIGSNPRVLKSGLHSREFYVSLWKTILSGKVWEGEFCNRKKNGELFWEKAIISPVLGIHGDITHFVAVKEDFTAKKIMMEELVTAKLKAEESDRLKTAFINNISHEIRTPLNGILGFGHLLSEMDISKEDRERYFLRLQKSSNRLLQTVNDYLKIAIIVSGMVEIKKEKFHLAYLVDEIKEMTRTHCLGKNLEPEFEIPAELYATEIYSAQNLISNILKILVDNAVKFTQKEKVTFGINSQEGVLEFFVRDTGKGIEKDKLHLIFDIFMQDDISNTRGYEGSGLGLAIAKGYADLLGGTLSVTSEIGVGSTFYFRLPANEVILT